MLPSKGYFKLLDCPYFEMGFCERPHCLFWHRHMKCNIMDSKNSNSRLLFEGNVENFIITEQQKPSIQNIEYRPTPISELNKLPMRQTSLANDKHFDYTLTELNFPEIPFKENATNYVSEEEIDIPVAYETLLSNDLQKDKCEQATNDSTIYSFENESHCVEIGNISNEGQIICKDNDDKISRPNPHSGPATENHENRCKKPTNSKISSFSKIKPSKCKNKTKVKNKPLEQSCAIVNKKDKTDENKEVKEGYNLETSEEPQRNYNKYERKISKKRSSMISKNSNDHEKKTLSSEFIVISSEPQRNYNEYEQKISKKRSSIKSKNSNDHEKKISISSEFIVISSEDESNSISNKQTDTSLSGKNPEMYHSKQSNNLLANDTIPFLTNTYSPVPNSKKSANKVIHSSASPGSKRNLQQEGDTVALNNQDKRISKTEISMESLWRDKIRKRADMMTPARRLLILANQRDQQKNEHFTLPKNDTTVKIRSVPNVQLLLQEKAKLLEIIASKNTNEHNSLEHRACSSITPLPTTLSNNDFDKTHKIILNKQCSEERGAKINGKQYFVKHLNDIERQSKRRKLFGDAQKRCLRGELKQTKCDSYTDNLNTDSDLTITKRSKISNLSLAKYSDSICPSRSIVIPQESNTVTQINKEGNIVASLSFYSSLLQYRLSEKQLISEGYPRIKTDSTSEQIIAYISKESVSKWKKTTHQTPPLGEYVCVNCNKFYSVDENGLSIDPKGCKYHAKKSWETKRKFGKIERHYRCCGRRINQPCMTSMYHSTEQVDLQNMEGFVETEEPTGSEPVEGWGIFALDCEMYWSTRGQEVGRVTVVNAEHGIIYDTFVKPERPVTDYCTRMSGLTEENLSKALVKLSGVQNALLKLFNSNTILIGHSLENDLKVLKLIHSNVVDTAVVFQELDRKVPLKTLASTFLKEIIQNEESGHDSAEDAVTCIKLMKQKIYKDASMADKKKAPVKRYRNQQRDIGLA